MRRPGESFSGCRRWACIGSAVAPGVFTALKGTNSIARAQPCAAPELSATESEKSPEWADPLRVACDPCCSHHARLSRPVWGFAPFQGPLRSRACAALRPGLLCRAPLGAKEERAGTPAGPLNVLLLCTRAAHNRTRFLARPQPEFSSTANSPSQCKNTAITTTF